MLAALCCAPGVVLWPGPKAGSASRLTILSYAAENRRRYAVGDTPRWVRKSR